MKSSSYAKRLARDIREVCLAHMRDHKISYQKLSELLGVPYRAAMTITQATDWTLDRAVMVAERLGVDVSLHLPTGGHVAPAQEEEQKNHCTLQPKARITLPWASR